ncbi:hypothetical protein SynA1825c_01433 [Synechococcus sp. A18-25c]|nr:hypothetical protein SynA1825c_01433 [Synechococcus sp. A18-25c]
MESPTTGAGLSGYLWRWWNGDDVFFLSFTVLSRWPGWRLEHVIPLTW